MIFVRLISTCRFAGLSSIIVALRVEFNYAIHNLHEISLFLYIIVVKKVYA
jgi:hypothetical protein